MSGRRDHGLSEPELRAFHHYLETGETPRSIARAKAAKRPGARIKAAVFSWTTVGVLLALSFVAHAVGVLLSSR